MDGVVWQSMLKLGMYLWAVEARKPGMDIRRVTVIANTCRIAINREFCTGISIRKITCMLLKSSFILYIITRTFFNLCAILDGMALTEPNGGG